MREMECESAHEFDTLPLLPNVGDQIAIHPPTGGGEIAVVTERRFVYFGQHDRVGVWRRLVL